MLITKNGSIDSVPSTSMVKQEGIWKHLLVCQVPLDTPDEELIALFDTTFVQDDAISVQWEYTQFDRITTDENYKYVWLTFAVQNIIADEYEEALNKLGVETQTVEEGVETDEAN